jgi:hypothetical protein
MLVMTVIAVDCAAIHRMAGWPDHAIVAASALLLMSNILAASGLRLLRRQGEPRPFLAGFVMTGWAVVLAGSACGYLGIGRPVQLILLRASENIVNGVLGWIDPYLPRSVILDHGAGALYAQLILFPFLIVLPVALTTVPLLALASLGGIVARRRASRRGGLGGPSAGTGLRPV